MESPFRFCREYMDIIIRTRTGKKFQLIRQDIAPSQNGSPLTREELYNLLNDAEPFSPGNWEELWHRVRPLSAANPSGRHGTVAALQDLAARNFLLVVPYEPQGTTRGGNRGASGGSG